MNQVIHKYQLTQGMSAEIPMPIGSKVLHFGYQKGIICCWALVDREPKGHVVRKYRIVGTGQTYDFKGRKYCATLQDPMNNEVWHIFEILS